VVNLLSHEQGQEVGVEVDAEAEMDMEMQGISFAT